MKIGTWNVEYASPSRLEALCKVLEDNPADIWILTETHDDLIPPDCLYFAHSEQRPKESPRVRPGSRWVSIWSRYPILYEVSVPRADKQRTVTALLDIGEGRKMLVYGTVMPWKGDPGKFDWSEHHRVIPQQCAEWSQLKEHFPGVELCIAGDFNTDMGTGSYYGTKKGIAALREGLKACGDFCATEPGKLPAKKPTCLPIDHIALPLAFKDRTKIVSA